MKNIRFKPELTKMMVLTLFILSIFLISVQSLSNSQNPVEVESLKSKRNAGTYGSLCLDEMNRERSRNGLEPFKSDSRLEKVANDHSQVMASQGCFAHNCGGEADYQDRVRDAGYQWGFLGQMLLAGHHLNGGCGEVVNEFMKQGTRDLILDHFYQDLGCAMASGGPPGYHYWTCIIARHIEE